MHVECERLFLWYLSIWQFNLRIRHTVTTIRISRSFLWYEMNELMHVMWLWFLGIWNGRFSRLLNLIYGCKIECLQGCFVKNSLLIHYFLADFRFFPMGFLCLSKIVPCKAFYSWKKWGLEWLPDSVGFIPNLSHYCKKLAFFFMFLKP